jgi:molybdate transport system ATP-binding protein
VSADVLEMRLALTRKTGFVLDIDGRIPLSGITAISGPSGGGKTTLLRALAGLEQMNVAEVRFGQTVWDAPGNRMPPELRRVGFVFQDAALFSHLTVADNIRYGARRRGVSHYDAILDALDLEPLLKRPVAGLSGGEARRVALGRALASDPAILFLDEPLSGLDQARKDELLPYIGRAVAEARVPALYVTHSRAEIAALADRVLGLEEGALTGWKAKPIRLRAQVVETMGRMMRVALAGAPEQASGARAVVPRTAEVGETVGLGIRSESLLVSAVSPGRSDAILQVPAKVVKGDGALTVLLYGEEVALHRVGPYAIGSTVWVSVREVAVRPERNDSAENRL